MFENQKLTTSEDVEKLEEIREKYNQELEQNFSSEECEKVIQILAESRKKVIENKNESVKINPAIFDTRTQEIFQLMDRYKNEIKTFFDENKIKLAHIASSKRTGKVHLSKNRDNNYMTESGNWYFAGSSQMEQNSYLARKAKDGLIGRNGMEIYGGDNIDVIKDEEGNCHAVLKEPNYMYIFESDKFLPVVSLLKNRSGNHVFDFSEEWVTSEEIDINEKDIIEISDITFLLENLQIFSNVNLKNLAEKLKSITGKKGGEEAVLNYIKNSNIRYINEECGININRKLQSLFSQKENKKADKAHDEL